LNNREKEIIALLPIKAHSSRIPRKNFRYFNGKPLFQWILNTLLCIDRISKIVINTDAEKELYEHGFKPTDKIFLKSRKHELCGDEVSMNAILLDDVNDFPADIYVMTHTTNPLLKAETILQAIACFEQKNIDNSIDSLFSVNRHQTRFYRNDATPINHDPDNLIPTQDLEAWYEENSNLYIFSKKSFMKTQARIGRQPIMYEMQRWESIDIDDQESWDLAEIIASVKLIA
jgi:CMP-N-acetylneuraminic acid synthetase